MRRSIEASTHWSLASRSMRLWPMFTVPSRRHIEDMSISENMRPIIIVIEAICNSNYSSQYDLWLSRFVFGRITHREMCNNRHFTAWSFHTRAEHEHLRTCRSTHAYTHRHTGTIWQNAGTPSGWEGRRGLEDGCIQRQHTCALAAIDYIRQSCSCSMFGIGCVPRQ